MPVGFVPTCPLPPVRLSRAYCAESSGRYIDGVTDRTISCRCRRRWNTCGNRGSLWLGRCSSLCRSWSSFGGSRCCFRRSLRHDGLHTFDEILLRHTTGSLRIEFAEGSFGPQCLHRRRRIQFIERLRKLSFGDTAFSGSIDLLEQAGQLLLRRSGLTSSRFCLRHRRFAHIRNPADCRHSVLQIGKRELKRYRQTSL